ncbi:MAG: glutamate ligase domain-containing protein, partial [Thermoplasmatota archaeon]
TRRITYGINNRADVRASNIRLGRQVDFTLHLRDESVATHVPLPGLHQVYNALAAAAVARAMRVRPARISAGLQQVKMAAGRLEVRELPTGVTVLDDSYNANPQSMAAALDVLENWPASGRRIAILADMLELGEAAPHCHTELGARAAQAADIVMVYGQWSTEVAEGVLLNAEGNTRVLRMHEHADICAWLQRHIKPDDCVLIKGSRGMRMEKIVDFLLHKLKKVA